MRRVILYTARVQTQLCCCCSAHTPRPRYFRPCSLARFANSWCRCAGRSSRATSPYVISAPPGVDRDT